ncbi:hypothetical protein Tco_1493248 [Tanacetum coccineum]
MAQARFSIERQDATLLMLRGVNKSVGDSKAFDRLQKLISQFEIHGENTLSLDDLYNNLKIDEPEVKWTSSSNTNTQNITFVSSNSTSSTNGAVNNSHDATMLSTQATAMAMLTMRARRYLKKNGRNFSVNGTETIGFDKSSLEEFMNEPIVSEPTVKKPIVETSEAKASTDKPKVVRKNFSPPLIEDWISDSEDDAESKRKIEKKIVKHSFAKIEFVKPKKQVKSTRKTTVKQGDQNRLNTYSPKGNKRNWNYMMCERLRSNFEMINKAFCVCGSFDHLQYDCDNHQR